MEIKLQKKKNIYSKTGTTVIKLEVDEADSLSISLLYNCSVIP